MALKRMMVIPPHLSTDGILRTLRSFFADGRDVFASWLLVHRGLSAKVMEFSVNYGVMGFSSVYVYAAAAKIFGEAR